MLRVYVSLYHPIAKAAHLHLCKGFEPGSKRKMKFQEPVCFSTPACLWPRRISALRCTHRAIHLILQPLLEIPMNQTKAYEKTYPEFSLTSVSFCFTIALTLQCTDRITMAGSLGLWSPMSFLLCIWVEKAQIPKKKKSGKHKCRLSLCDNLLHEHLVIDFEMHE